MTSLQKRLVMRSSVTALCGALATLSFVPAVDAADDSELIRALTQPTNFVEIGALYVDESSAKFGEYNGLNKQGAYAIGNFQLYGRAGNDDVVRWRLLGSDLGLDTRTVTGEVGEQGRWRVTAGYEGIPRHYSDTFKTIWQGAGTSTLTLPPGYPAAATRLSVTNTPAGLLSNWNNIQTPNATATTTGGGPAFVIPANLYNFDVGTERKRTNVGMSTVLGPGWDFKASVRHEEKDGTKLTGANMGGFSGISALVPEPIHSTIDTFDASLGFVGEKGHFNVSYYGSLYKNDINLWTVESAGANNVLLNNVARFQGYPDNQMHQINLTGGYKFSPTTKLVVTGSYARLTQNEQFIDPPVGSTWVLPETSANAKTINSFFLARLTSRATNDLNLTAQYKIEDRDNKTPVKDFCTTRSDAPGACTVFTTTPLNRRLQQANLEADYKLGRGQALRGEYEYQEIKRTADGEETPFRADKTYENTLRLEYRKTLAETLTGRVAYSYGERRVKDYEQGNPQPTNPPAPLPAADPALTGFEQFFLADRDRHKLRSRLNYDASDSLSLQATLDYNQDHYRSLQFGLKKSDSWVLGVDGTLAASEALSINGFYTYEDMKMNLDSLAIARGLTTTNLVPHVSGPPCAPYTNVANTLPADYFTDPCRQWSESQSDRVHTLGVAAKYAGLLGGRLTLTGDLTYARARTPISVNGGTYYNNGVPNSPTGNVFIPATSFPDITSEMIDVRLAGLYALDKSSAVRVAYWYRHLSSSDWAYDAYTNSALGVLAIPGYLGPGITSPNYNVQVVGVSYIYRWQ
jgi:MtrB/PioB family decaheme-associated outer membrane protein